MVRALSLSAYRALSRRGVHTPYTPTAPRPEGDLIWLHAPEPGSTDTATNLARRLIAACPGTGVLLTTTVPETRDCKSAPAPICETLQGDHPDNATKFTQHWKPDVVVWLWGDLQPNLVLEIAATNVPMILADAGEGGFDGWRDRWLRDVPRKVLTCFDRIIARSDAARARLTQLGCTDARLEKSAPLQSSAIALPYSRTDFDELANVLRGRPVWYAVGVQPAEVRVVLEAHRHAMRLSHRLLLVLSPADAAQEEACATELKHQGLRVARWDDGQFPDDNCQVLLAAGGREHGLWYRTAPVSFLGSSLVAGKGGLDPMQAAALGSAVLYGPNVRNHLHAYSRMASAGAARIVNDAGALGVAVARLIAPDHAASMALAGWEVASESAAVTDRIVELVQDALDAQPRRQ